jgi:hypothetical protein
VGRPDVLPSSFRFDQATKVHPGGIEDARGGKSITQTEYGRAALLAIGEKLELRMLDELGEASDCFIDSPGSQKLFALRDASCDVLSA